MADLATCTAVGGCITTTSCCTALSVSATVISKTTNLVCLPVWTKYGAEVACAVSSACATAAKTYLDAGTLPAYTVVSGKMYAATACTNKLAAEGASHLAASAVAVASILYVTM